eukprot:6608898-Prymnesium_polylepis.1
MHVESSSSARGMVAWCELNSSCALARQVAFLRVCTDGGNQPEAAIRDLRHVVGPECDRSALSRRDELGMVRLCAPLQRLSAK